MAKATLARVGNSAAAFIPSATRKLADIEIGQGYDIESPRPGVVVLTFRNERQVDRLSRLKMAEDMIRNTPMRPWGDSKDAEELIRRGKEERSSEIVLP